MNVRDECVSKELLSEELRRSGVDADEASRILINPDFAQVSSNITLETERRLNKVVLKANKKHSICLFHCIPELTEAFLLPTGYRQFRWIRNVFSRRSEVGRKVNQGRMKQNLLSFSPDSYLKPTSTVTVVTF